MIFKKQKPIFTFHWTDEKTGKEYNKEFKIDKIPFKCNIKIPKNVKPVHQYYSIKGPAKNLNVLKEGMFDFSNLEESVKILIKDCKTEEEKAIKIWEFVSTHLYHWVMKEYGDESYDSISLLNNYGYTMCGGAGALLESFFSKAGFKSRTVSVPGHFITEVYYNNKWHMFDADIKCYFRNKKEIISIKKICNRSLKECREIKLRTNLPHNTYSKKGYLKFMPSIKGIKYIKHMFQEHHKLNQKLNLNDFYVRQNYNERYFHEFHHEQGRYYFGEPLIYTNSFSLKKIKSKKINQELIIPIKQPFVITGSEVCCSFMSGTKGKVELYFSENKKKWKKVKNISCDSKNKISLTERFKKTSAKYKYYLKIVNKSKESKLINNLEIKTIMQQSVFTFPTLETGTNKIVIKKFERSLIQDFHIFKNQIIKKTYHFVKDNFPFIFKLIKR